jgi:hypothetical protein
MTQMIRVPTQQEQGPSTAPPKNTMFPFLKEKQKPN